MYIYLITILPLLYTFTIFRSYLFIYLAVFYFLLNVPAGPLSLNFLHDSSYWVSLLQALNSPIYNVLIFYTFILLVRSVYFLSTPGLSYVVILLFLLLFCAVNNSNSNIITLSTSQGAFNVKLTNGLLLIHPLLLYFYYSLLLGFTFTNLISLLFSKYSLVKPQWANYTMQPPIFLLGLCTLFLGSWWSHQELNWGGFWSWDLVEVFLLIVLSYNLITVHTRQSKFSYPLHYAFFIVNFFMYILSVRFNMIGSIHNFISQGSSTYKVSYVVYMVVCLAFLLLVLLYSPFAKGRPVTTNITPHSLLTLFFYILSIYVILNYSYFYILKSTTNLLLTTTLSLLVPLIFSFSIIYNNFLFLLFPLAESSWLCFIFSWFRRLSPVTLVHFFLSLLFYYLFIYYGLYLLGTISVDNQFTIWSIKLLNSFYLESVYAGAPEHAGSTNIPLNQYLRFFYSGNSQISIDNLSMSLVIYPVTWVFYASDCVTFFHRAFSKLGFSFNIYVLYSTIMFFYAISQFKYYSFRY